MEIHNTAGQSLQSASRLDQIIDRQDAILLLGKKLILCCPVGMSDGDRADWLVAAADDLQQRGMKLKHVQAAMREICSDHPSKIIGDIVRHYKQHNEFIC